VIPPEVTRLKPERQVWQAVVEEQTSQLRTEQVSLQIVLLVVRA
jgi:hypothetical protein